MFVYVVEGCGGDSAVWGDDGGQDSRRYLFVLFRGMVVTLEGKALEDVCL